MTTLDERIQEHDAFFADVRAETAAHRAYRASAEGQAAELRKCQELEVAWNASTVARIRAACASPGNHSYLTDDRMMAKADVSCIPDNILLRIYSIAQDECS